MDIESAGGGAGIGGVIGAVLTYMGIRQKVDDMQKGMDKLESKHDTEMTEMKKVIVFDNTCKAHRDGFKDYMKSIDEKLKYLIERIDHRDAQ